uniref:Reverse transcriptase domain-containing protein n=1 Tax=Maylandia zebra TaxID=106582 RepID=A0A3P9CE79_9CICH
MSADSGASSIMVLLELTSAFDTIDHTILINRLRDVVGVSGLALKWFQSYLSNRSFSVFANQFMSHSKDLTCGVRQGSVLGPILFLLYMLPLGLIIRQFPEVSYHFYADDILLYCSFKPMEVLSSLIKCLASIEQWLGDNYLQLNSEKNINYCPRQPDISNQTASWFSWLSCSPEPQV